MGIPSFSHSKPHLSYHRLRSLVLIFLQFQISFTSYLCCTYCHLICMDLIQIYTPMVVLFRSYIDLNLRASDLPFRGTRRINDSMEAALDPQRIRGDVASSS